MLSDLQQRQLERAENAYLDEPRDVSYAPKCEKCGCNPIDDYLYNVNGKWCCSDCALDTFERWDVLND